MKHALFSLVLMAMMLPLSGWAQKDRGDSIDIVHTSLVLDLARRTPNALFEHAEVTFVHTGRCSQFAIDIICDSLYDVVLDGQRVSADPYAELYSNEQERMFLPTLGSQIGDTHVLQIDYLVFGSYEFVGNLIYSNHSLTDGGLWMNPDESCFYTLGEDRYNRISHSVGRAWHPCRDNFYEKSTYDITITTIPGWHCQCSGVMQDETMNDDGSYTSRWVLTQPASSYQVSIWAADGCNVSRTVQGHYDTYPMSIHFHINDLNDFVFDTSLVTSTYSCMDTVLTTFERCFGPYGWNRVGFVTTNVWCGMEHIDNITLGSSAVFDQNTVIHEFAHQWFGNLVTCADEPSMWINEGGATFAEEVAYEKLHGKDYSDNVFQSYLSQYLLSSKDAPVTLTNQPFNNTMLSDTYYKGTLAWHMLRGYMGDSLFYASMSRLFQNHRYNSINTAQLIDSLSLYSGIDLSMPLHLMANTPGFVEYQLDSLRIGHNSATIGLSSQAIYTDYEPQHHRVPVTFFSNDRQQQELRYVCFDGVSTSQTFELPFTPGFAVVDYHKRLSDASTDAELTIGKKGTHSLKYGFAKVVVPENSSDPNGWVHIAHHFAHPMGQESEGIVRLSNRYWQVSGFVPWEPEVNGQFYYNRQGYATTSTQDDFNVNNFQRIGLLDKDFYVDRSTIDSLALVYRADASQPWQVVSRSRTKSSTENRGFFVARLFPGQYALAVIDSNMLSLPDEPVATDSRQLHLSPNPAQQQITIDDLPLGTEVKVYNMQGLLMLTHRHDGSPLNVGLLPQGVYIVATPEGRTKLIKQ